MGKNKAKPYIIQAFVALFVVILGLFIGMKFFNDKTVPQKRERRDVGILVEVVTVNKADHNIALETTGEVEASRSMSLKSEASGRVTWVSDNFYPGAHIKKGEVLAKISTEDYRIKLEQSKITLKQREAELVLEQAKGRAAEADLDKMKLTMFNGEEDLTAEEAAIIKRSPQLQQALANVEQAKLSQKQAQIDYDRSVIKAPYDAVIQQTNISIGDYVSGATALGTIVASDQFWVKISLQPSLIAWTGASKTSLDTLEASVSYDIGGQTITRKAHVLSMLSEVESLGRMVQLVLAVDDPLGEPVDAPLLIGTFVHASLKSPTPLPSVELPRSLVREGGLVYVCNPQNELEIRSITTPYKTDTNVYITEGLNDGERVVTTLISSPSNKRKLRVKGETRERGEVSDDVGRMGFGGPPGGGPPR